MLNRNENPADSDEAPDADDFFKVKHAGWRSPLETTEAPLPAHGPEGRSLLDELIELRGKGPIANPNYMRGVVSTVGVHDARTILDKWDTDGDEWPEADVAAAFARGIEAPVPSVLQRADGRALLYRGLPNVIFGEGGIGKSWLANWAAAQEIVQGHHVYVVDYELNLNVWLSRLVNVGLTPEQIAPYLHYLDVRTGMKPPAELHDDSTLVVVDSLSGAIESYGLEPNDTNSIEAVYRQVVDPFTAADMAALVIDHVGHSDKSRPMNSIRKINRVQGAMYRMEPVAGRPLGRGQIGELLLYLFKDNAGGTDMPKGAVAARFVMASAEEGTDVRCQLVGGNDLATLSAVAQQSPMARKKQDILRVLQHYGELNRSDVRKHAKGKSDFVNTALDELVKEGEVFREHRGNADYFRYAEEDLEP